jgi:ketosteroid isomerase-like protein
VSAGARTPEELDVLLEDAFVLRDRAACHSLFADGAVLADSTGLQARGRDAIGDVLAARWGRQSTYLALPGQVLQSRNTALLVSDTAIHVLRRSCDGVWRAAISLLLTDSSTRSEER